MLLISVSKHNLGDSYHLRKVLPQKYIAFVVGVCSQPFYKFLFARKAFYFYPVAKRILLVFSLVFTHSQHSAV